MVGPAYLHGDRLSLRTVESEDHAFVHEQANSPSVRRWTYWNVPRSRDEVTDYLDGRDAPHFLPCLDGDPIGYAWLMDVDETSGHAEVGFWIVQEERDSGYATETLDLVVEYAFQERGLRRLFARVFEGNDASMRVLEKVGFEREGCLREHYYVDGGPVDALIFGLLSCDR